MALHEDGLRMNSSASSILPKGPNSGSQLSGTETPSAPEALSYNFKGKGEACRKTPLCLYSVLPLLAKPQASGQVLLLIDSLEPRPPPATLPRDLVWLHEAFSATEREMYPKCGQEVFPFLVSRESQGFPTVCMINQFKDTSVKTTRGPCYHRPNTESVLQDLFSSSQILMDWSLSSSFAEASLAGAPP